VKRGRPSDEYPSEEFRRRAAQRIGELNLTVREVEGRSGVNRGTISQILRGLRHCAPDDRHALMVALDFDAQDHHRFLPLRETRIPDLVLYDDGLPYGGTYLPIQRAVSC
jgi:transcriptional regulator with XRE-family HTH domain